jgi:hypothetical protein
MTIVKFPAIASRRIAARRPRRSKNGTPEERAAKAAAQSTHATVAGIHFDPATWVERCAAAGMQVCEHNGHLFFGVADADWDQITPLLIQFRGTPGAKETVKAFLRPDSTRSAASS